jgi:hypothetical protein
MIQIQSDFPIIPLGIRFGQSPRLDEGQTVDRRIQYYYLENPQDPPRNRKGKNHDHKRFNFKLK